MPPKRHQKSRNPSDQEGRVLLAVKAFQNREIPNITEAARRFEVPRSTLRDRVNGHRNRSETRANNHKLTETEEQSLLQWMLRRLRGTARLWTDRTKSFGSAPKSAMDCIPLFHLFGRPVAKVADVRIGMPVPSCPALPVPGYWSQDHCTGFARKGSPHGGVAGSSQPRCGAPRSRDDRRPGPRLPGPLLPARAADSITASASRWRTSKRRRPGQERAGFRLLPAVEGKWSW